MVEKNSYTNAIALRLTCGCLLDFLEHANIERMVPLEKSTAILNAYETLFSTYYSDFLPKRILEIGVKHGGGLLLLDHVFSRVSSPEIVGVDKDPRLTELAKAHLATHTSKISVITALVPAQLDRVPGTFDLVIDDGSHAFDDIIGAFEILWPRLNSGGLYVVEDWRTDASHPIQLMEILLQRMIGYWPDPKGPGKGAPVQVHWWRDLVAIQKGSMNP